MPPELPPPSAPGLEWPAPESRKEAQPKIEFTPEQAEFIADFTLELCKQTEYGRPSSPLRKADHWAKQTLAAVDVYGAPPRIVELVEKIRDNISELSRVQQIASRMIRERVVNGRDITRKVQEDLQKIRMTEDS